MKTFYKPIPDNKSDDLLFTKNTTSPEGTGVEVRHIKLIKFELKKETFLYVHPNDILFVTSADHYVKSIVHAGKEIKSAIRHCTLKELFTLLPAKDFIRLNKFYILNRNHFLSFNETERKLHLKNNISIYIIHRISPFILETIKR